MAPPARHHRARPGGGPARGRPSRPAGGAGRGRPPGAGRSSASLLAAFAAFGIFWGAWSALLPDVRAQTGAGDAELGLALLAIAAGAMPAMLLVGRRVRRTDGAVLAAALAAFGVAGVLPGLAGSPEALGAALLALGAASGAVDVLINAAVAAEEARGGHPLMQRAHAAFPLAALTASALAGLARAAGARPAVVLTAVLAALVLVALVLLRAGPARAAVAGGRGGRDPFPPRHGPRSRPLLLLGAAAAIALLVEQALQQWSAIHLESGLGASPATGALGPAVLAGAVFAGRALAQRCAHRVPGSRLIAAGVPFALLGLALLAAAPTPATALAGVALAGLGIAAATPALYAIAGRRAGATGRTAAISAVATVGYLGFLAGPPLVGALASVISLRGALGALTALIAVLLAAVPLLGRIERDATSTRPALEFKST